MKVPLNLYTVRLSRTAAKAFTKIPEPYRGRIAVALTELPTNPFIGKLLKGELVGLYSLRVWPYRIIYRIQLKELLIEILDIGHRQGIYK